MVIIADCKRAIHFEFFLGTRKARRISVVKINLLIEVLTQFRDALKGDRVNLESEVVVAYSGDCGR